MPSYIKKGRLKKPKKQCVTKVGRVEGVCEWGWGQSGRKSGRRPTQAGRGSLPRAAAVGSAGGGAALCARPHPRPQPHRPVQFCAQPQLRDAADLGQFGRALRLLALGQLHAQLGLGAARGARRRRRRVGGAAARRGRGAVGGEGVGRRARQAAPQPRVPQRRRRRHPLLGVPLQTLGDEVEEERVVTAF